MSEVAAMVSELIAAGCAPEVAAKVVSESFLAGVLSADVRVTQRDESVTHKREVDRLRKQRWRDRHGMSRDDRDTSRDVTDASLSKNNLKEEREEPKRDVRGQRLPENWEPSPEDATAASQALGVEQAGAELLKFRDHWRQQPGSKGLSLDWNAAWRNWVRRAEEYAGRQKPVAGKPTTNGAHSLDEAAWNQILVSYKKFGHWSRDAGPDPDSPACRCPRELLEKHGIACAAENSA